MVVRLMNIDSVVWLTLNSILKYIVCALECMWQREMGEGTEKRKRERETAMQEEVKNGKNKRKRRNKK